MWLQVGIVERWPERSQRLRDRGFNNIDGVVAVMGSPYGYMPPASASAPNTRTPLSAHCQPGCAGGERYSTPVPGSEKKSLKATICPCKRLHMSSAFGRLLIQLLPSMSAFS